MIIAYCSQKATCMQAEVGIACFFVLGLMLQLLGQTLMESHSIQLWVG